MRAESLPHYRRQAGRGILGLIVMLAVCFPWTLALVFCAKFHFYWQAAVIGGIALFCTVFLWRRNDRGGLTTSGTPEFLQSKPQLHGQDVARRLRGGC